MAASGGISSPGSVANADPATHAQSAITITTMAIPVRWANSFSMAIRRRPSGVTATNSRLPRRASAARVPDRARTDHRAAMRPSEAPVFQAIEPPSVSMPAGNGLP